MQKKTNLDQDCVWSNVVVRSLTIETEGTYRVELGISAQLFFLEKKNADFKRLLTLLKFSLDNNKKIKISIEKNTNKILKATL
jgi:hypothetical protein